MVVTAAIPDLLAACVLGVGLLCTAVLLWVTATHDVETLSIGKLRDFSGSPSAEIWVVTCPSHGGADALVRLTISGQRHNILECSRWSSCDNCDEGCLLHIDIAARLRP